MRNLGVAEDHELRWLFGNVPRLIPRLIALYWLMYDMWTNYPLCTYVCYMNELLLYIHFIFPKMCFIPISSPFRTATYLALFFEDHTSHLASRLSSMERDAKAATVNGGEEEWLPRGKIIWQTKKVTTTTELPDCLYFLNLSSMFIFLGWRIFEHIKWQIFNHGLFEALKVCSTAMMWGATGILTTHDPGKLIPIFLDRGREVKMVGDGNQWRFMIRFLWMRKLGVFVSKTFWCWSL